MERRRITRRKVRAYGDKNQARERGRRKIRLEKQKESEREKRQKTDRRN